MTTDRSRGRDSWDSKTRIEDFGIETCDLELSTGGN